MADQNITALPAVTTPESSDQLLLVGATEEKLIDYDKLADAILGKIASKNFALDQGNKTLLQALNELNSKTAVLQGKYLMRQFLNENETQEFQLGAMGVYILTTSDIAVSNIQNGDIALVTTGASSANTSKIIWFTNNCGNHECFFFDPDDGLKFKITIGSSMWVVASLTAL